MRPLQDAVYDFLLQPNYAVVSVPRPDGTVQSVVVWQAPAADRSGVELNSAEGRDWPAHLRKAKTATVLVIGRDPYQWVAITGPLIQDTHEGADEHIDALAKKFLGKDSYPFRRPGEQRIKLVIGADRVKYVRPR